MKKIITTTALATLIPLTAMAGLGLNPKLRLDVDSGWFSASEDDLKFTMTYNGWNLVEHKRLRNRGIAPEAIEMVKNAKTHIVASAFLFDTMYSTTTPEYPVTEELAKLLISKKKENPNIKITFILDALNRAYSRRMPPVVKSLIDNGIDVFYSDMISTKAANNPPITEAIGTVNRGLDIATLGLAGSTISQVASVIDIPTLKLDRHNIDLEVAFGAALMKVNHRKILVTDIDGTDQMVALVTSANPHNGSDDSTNTSIVVKGEVAKFIFGVLREDVGHSLNHQSRLPLNIGPDKYAQLSKQSKKSYDVPNMSIEKQKAYLDAQLPPVDFSKLQRGSEADTVRVKFVTEESIKRDVIRLLDNTTPDDEVRIQMFYLSEPDVVNAIARVAAQPGRKSPVKLLLDPSKDAFNQIKDGTPNRQVAHFLMNKPGKLEVRWYATFGEQNHAKIMSITNEATKKYEMSNGSCNWTGKNMNNINMESNLTVVGARKVNQDFNQLFDKFWNNEEENILYSYPYDQFDLKTTQQLNAGFKKIKKWSQEKREAFAQAHLEEVTEIMKLENRELNLALADEAAWVQEKINKDSTSLTRALSLIHGKKEAKNFKGWSKSYMNKWINGEKTGLVGW